ncbi:MAG: PcfB family protein [Oscillospiraceae bacterium]|nr:PcfB family protein [Oscillospiraceae bacterium]
MDTSGEVADLFVKEGIVLTEESIKLLAAGSKNLAALLWAFARDEKKLVGMTGMTRLLREGKPLKVFRLKESDLEEFKAYAKKNVLFSVVKDSRAEDGMVDLVTNVDFVAQVNLFMERRGYGAIAQEQEGGSPKKDNPLAARQSSSLPQRGSGSTASRTRPTRTRPTSEEAPAQEKKPSMKEKLEACKVEAKNRAKDKQRSRPSKPKTR